MQQKHQAEHSNPEKPIEDIFRNFLASLKLANTHEKATETSLHTRLYDMLQTIVIFSTNQEFVLAVFPQALEHGAEAADSDEEEAEPAEPTYIQEQQDLKRNFLQARHTVSSCCLKSAC